jgi:aminomethyltransferase
VTSSGFAPSLNASIAMGYVAAAHSAPDTRLETEVGGKRMALKVSAMPFVPHRSHRKSELV